MKMKTSKIALALAVLNIVVMIASVSVVASIVASNTNTLGQEAAKQLTMADAVALVGAAIGLLGSTLAAGIALRGVATAGFAAMVENPETKTWMLIMGGLAEGIAVYGLLLAILILGKI